MSLPFPFDERIAQIVTGNYDDDDDERYEDPRPVVNRADFKLVASERYIESYSYVYRHVPTDTLFEFSVPYSSWSGHYWDDMETYVVEPVEKTIIVYERVGKKK